MSFETINIFGVPIAIIEENALIDLIEKWLSMHAKGYITGINAHALNIAISNSSQMDFYKKALLNCSEGMGVTIASIFYSAEKPKRIIWALWINKLLQMLEEKRYSIFFLGGSEETINSLVMNLNKKYPSLIIAGAHHGYFSESDNKNVLRIINDVHPDVIIVAMGMPKQEEWIKNNINSLNTILVFPVGALLDYLSGLKKRCPNWIATLGFEWFYRLIQEPRRLWRRYLIGIPEFFIRVIIHRISH